MRLQHQRACLLAAALCCQRTLAAGPPDLDLVLARVLSRPELRTSTCGIIACRLDTGEVLLEHDADKLLAPASNTKLVSSAGALVTLGKDFLFETGVVPIGPVAGGILDGDLVLVGSGDPNLSQRITPEGKLAFEDKDHSYAGFYDASVVPGDPLKVLRKLAADVARSGVREVRGDVVADDGLLSEGDDEFVGPFSAICVNDNLIDVTVRPGARPGEPALFDYQPQGSVIEVTSTARTADEGSETALWLKARDGVAAFELSGAIAAGSRPVLRTASFRNPALAAANLLVDLLRSSGVEIRGRAARRSLGPAAYRDRPTLARHVSPPLSEALKIILKTSQNLHATLLPPIVGAVRGQSGDRRSGWRVISDAFAKGGLDTGEVTLSSGSGGGRADHLSPRWTASLLRFMAARDDFPTFLEALPVGGVDGTLESAFKAQGFERRVRAKTGTLVYESALNNRWVYVSKSLSGYLDTRPSLEGPPRPGDLIAFSIIIAGTIADSRKKGSDDLFRAQEDILRAVLDHAKAREARP